MSRMEEILVPWEEAHKYSYQSIRAGVHDQKLVRVYYKNNGEIDPDLTYSDYYCRENGLGKYESVQDANCVVDEPTSRNKRKSGGNGLMGMLAGSVANSIAERRAERAEDRAEDRAERRAERAEERAERRAERAELFADLRSMITNKDSEEEREEQEEYEEQEEREEQQEHEERKEIAEEFDEMRKEMKQGLDDVREEVAKGINEARKEFSNVAKRFSSVFNKRFNK